MAHKTSLIRQARADSGKLSLHGFDRLFPYRIGMISNITLGILKCRERLAPNPIDDFDGVLPLSVRHGA
ncbi:hypothetical protein IL54_4227 [Sphingobium sp. ba1]|nr:hypothetical protein IL54_4227 [Sphingobium sp. ba1]